MYVCIYNIYTYIIYTYVYIYAETERCYILLYCHKKSNSINIDICIHVTTSISIHCLLYITNINRHI